MIRKPVVIEGPDGGGKSTLIGQLLDDENMTLAPKFSHSTRGPNSGHIFAASEDMKSPLSAGYIYDRHPAISEPIYGTAIRKKDDYVYLSPYVNEWLDKVYVVMCLPPFGEVIYHLNPSEQMPGVAENYPLIYGLYEYIYNLSPSRFIHYDYTEPNSYEELRRKLNA